MGRVPSLPPPGAGEDPRSSAGRARGTPRRPSAYRDHRLLGLGAALALATHFALCAPRARAGPSDGLPAEFRPSFPLFGSGPVVNFAQGDNSADTNAVAHTMASLALPLLGEKLWGRKGLWIVGLGWIGYSLVQESLFHAPARPGPGYAAEFRADLLTRIVPCAALLAWDAIRPHEPRGPFQRPSDGVGSGKRRTGEMHADAPLEGPEIGAPHRHARDSGDHGIPGRLGAGSRGLMLKQEGLGRGETARRSAFGLALVLEKDLDTLRTADSAAPSVEADGLLAVDSSPSR